MTARKERTRSATKAEPRDRQRDGRTRLLSATEEILSEHGLDKVTLREAARRAGVSHGAPAFHFGNAAGLLTACAATGYNTLVNLMLRYRSEAERDRRSQLFAAARAYVDFAMAHRGSFQLIFRSDRLKAEDLHFREASNRAFEQLKEVFAPFFGRHDTDRDQTVRVLMAWSVVHGVATLALEGYMSRIRRGLAGPNGAQQLPREMLDRFLAGWTVAPRVGIDSAAIGRW